MKDKEQQAKHFIGILTDKYLKPFQRRPTLIGAKQAFVAFHEKGLPIPDDILEFFVKKFTKEIGTQPEKPTFEESDNERAILVELMIRIAKSQDNVSINSICQEMAEEVGIRGNDTSTAGELLRQRMENFKERSKVRNG